MPEQEILLILVESLVLTIVFAVICAKFGIFSAICSICTIVTICAMIPYAVEDPEKFALCVALTIFSGAIIWIMLHTMLWIEDRHWKKMLKELEEEEENKQ